MILSKHHAIGRSGSSDGTYLDHFRRHVLPAWTPNRLERLIEDRLAGQEHLRTFLEELQESISSNDTPKVVALACREGANHRSIAEAIALSVHRDREKLFVIDGRKIQTSMDLQHLFGIPPCYHGFPGRAIFAESEVSTRFGAKRPLIVLIEHAEEIGSLSGEIDRSFWWQMRSLFWDGVIHLNDGSCADFTKLDGSQVSPPIIVITWEERLAPPFSG